MTHSSRAELDGSHHADLLSGGGAMGAAMRAHDWAAGPLGPPETWPVPLRTLVGVMLAAEQPMFVAWGEARTMLYNDGYVALLGRKHPAALGRPFMEVWSEAEADLAPLVARTFAGEPVHMEDITLFLERHGAMEEAHFSFSYTPVRDETGEVAGLFCPCAETTEQVTAERRRAFLLALDDATRALLEPRAIMEAAATALGRHLRLDRVGYGEVYPDGATIEMTTAYTDGVAPLSGRLDMTEFNPEKLERQRQGETIVFDDALADPANDCARWTAIEARGFVSVSLVRQGALRATFYATCRAPRAWTPEDVRLIEEVASRTWDAVERARSEEALREANDLLEHRVRERTRERDRVWRNSRDLLLVVGADGLFRAVNPAWTALLGHDPDEVVGHPYTRFVWPEDAERTKRAFETAVSGQNVTGFETRFRHKDGTFRWIAWHTSLEGALVYASGRDVTAGKRQAEALQAAEDALRQSQKMEAVGQLTGGLAHDFNNLLTGIAGSLELLQMRLAQGRTDDLERYATAAQGAATRAAALTHRLLAFSRRQTLEPKPTDVNRLVGGMSELIRRTVGPAVELEVAPAAGLWPTLVDPNQLENALLNLCINARDAMPDGGRLLIETGNRLLDAAAAGARDLPEGAYVSLCVSDTGIGMTPEVARRAFDPFFTTKPIGMGTGLGLSMIYGFVQQSGGQARIHSEPGRGATVCLYLPRHGDAEASAEVGTRPVTPASAQRGETVLVVDDEPTVRVLVAEVLQDHGYMALEAEDGAEALALLQSAARIDLLVTDVGLPGGMNGRQVADAARVARPGLKVLFITGYADTAVLSHGHLEAGMQVLTKPFTTDALAARVRVLLAG